MTDAHRVRLATVGFMEGTGVADDVEKVARSRNGRPATPAQMLTVPDPLPPHATIALH
jgi:hypothetical protein